MVVAAGRTAQYSCDAILKEESQQAGTRGRRPVEICGRLIWYGHEGWVVHHWEGVRLAAASGLDKRAFQPGPLRLSFGSDGRQATSPPAIALAILGCDHQLLQRKQPVEAQNHSGDHGRRPTHIPTPHTELIITNTCRQYQLCC